MNVYLYVKRNYIYKEKLRSYRDLNFFLSAQNQQKCCYVAVMLLVLKYIYIYTAEHTSRTFHINEKDTIISVFSSVSSSIYTYLTYIYNCL